MYSPAGQPDNVSPRLGKPFVCEPVAHRGIEASADISPPRMSKVADDRPGQLVGLRKCTSIHGLSGLRRCTEHLADLLPRSARLSRLLPPHACTGPIFRS